jgi:hypothetical protein
MLITPLVLWADEVAQVNDLGIRRYAPYDAFHHANIAILETKISQ